MLSSSTKKPTFDKISFVILP